MSSRFDALVLSYASEAVVITTPDGRIVHWTAPAEALFGYSVAEAIRRRIAEIVGTPDRDDYERQRLRETIANGCELPKSR